MGNKYLETKNDTLESSILDVWKDAAKLDEYKTRLGEKKRVSGGDNRRTENKQPKEEGLESSPNAANSQHLCAKNVVHEDWGEGQPVHGMHAIPNSGGDIAWYDVMFEHGVEKGVSINELKITKSESHHNHDGNGGKKKKKEEAELDDDVSGRIIRRTNALEREAERLREILEDFLQFAGRMKLAATFQDARLIVDQLVDFFHPQCDRSGILLRADLQEGPIMARLDESLFKQAILNLLINALQAMDDSASKQEDGELIIRLESDETTLRLHVIDQGLGITPDRLEEIFHPYVSSKSGGSGLGLPTTLSSSCLTFLSISDRGIYKYYEDSEASVSAQRLIHLWMLLLLILYILKLLLLAS